MTEGKLHEGWKTNIVAGLLSLFGSYASAQSTEESKPIKDKIEQVVSNLSPEQLQQARDKVRQNPKFSSWSDEALDKIFDFSVERDKPELNVGQYKHVVNVKPNSKTNGEIRYTVDILDRAYLESDIFNKIKELNSDLKGVTIDFEVKGKGIGGKSIKL